MNIFVSWSGERSRKVAELLRTWVVCVIQDAKLWVSSEDIDRGAVWFNSISSELSNSAHGIVCLTKENLNKPWILFEAGAMANRYDKAKVFTLLIDLSDDQVHDPLAQFNHTHPERESMRKLLESINRSLDVPLSSEILLNCFEAHWPKFETSMSEILKQTNTGPEPVQPDEEDFQSEMMNMMRSLIRKLDSSHNESREPARPLRVNGLRTIEFENVLYTYSHSDYVTEFKKLGIPVMASNTELGHKIIKRIASSKQDINSILSDGLVT